VAELSATKELYQQ